MMYSAPIWARATKNESYLQDADSVQRLCALRGCCAFRTVSHDAALVISGVIPIDLLALESVEIRAAWTCGLLLNAMLGCFKYYLNRFKHKRYPHCPLCDTDNEDAEHVFFVCPRFENERRDLSMRVGRTPAACNLVDIMLDSEENWSAVCNMATIVLKKLRNAERLRNSNR
ncbi:hypothetical protein KR084_003968, partial [Drosophila pseudotakahashii]